MSETLDHEYAVEPLVHQTPTLPDAPTAVTSFVSGQAGTGKTFLSKAWASLDEGAELCATTGIAAINLGGTTINALLGYFDTHSLRDAYITGKLHARLRKNRDGGTYWYLLDEVSMLSGEQLTYLTRAINEVNKPTALEKLSGDEHDPVRITLIGDFAQLPPVNESFAFESEYWPMYQQNRITLTEIRRQSDRPFIEALQAVRRGDADGAIDYFRHRFCPAISMSFEGVTIKAKNDDVDRFNYVRLSECIGREVTFSKQMEGVPRSEWKQIPDNLHLKIGALVMILSNKRDFTLGEFIYVNGDLGILEDVTSTGEAYVKLHRSGESVLVTPVIRENLKTATPERRQELREQGLGDRVKGKHEVIGSVCYMPLRAAYATTVHKSQGLSLDSVQVDIRNHFFTNPGSLYVALSRARTPDGLRLVGSPELFKKRCVVASKVQEYL